MDGLGRAALLIVSSVAFGVPAVARAQDAGQVVSAPAEATELPEVVVRGRAEDLLGAGVSASQGVLDRVDLEDKPLLRRGEVLETVPGMVVTQHSGEGKANQYFLRGFNLDHGTDFALSVDGIPVNLRSHAHGQGYTDLNFVIPELVDRLEFKKGPFYPEVGDFSGAGAADLRLASRLLEAIGRAEVGMFGHVRALVADSPTVGPGNLLYAVEYGHYDGPWELKQGSNRVNGVLRYAWGDGRDRFRLTGGAYLAPLWHATDQIAQRAVDSGQISRLGALDASDGGTTGRGSLYFDWVHEAGERTTRLLLYGTYYRLDLYSNFTYFLDDPVNGDQFEQVDRRLVAGGELSHTWRAAWGSFPVENTLGLQLRNDYIPTVSLRRTVGRELVGVTSDDRVEELSVGAYAGNQIRWTSWLRTAIGLRADVYAIDVASDTAANSGGKAAAIVNPKATLTFGPWAKTELYVDFGTGFHSNDARGATVTVGPDPANPPAQVPLLVRTVGAELGLRTAILPGLASTLSLWYLRSESELTFAGDSGDTEANPPSRKFGVEWSSSYRPLPWLTLAADISATRARYVDNPAGDAIANSIPFVLTGGATVDTPTGAFGSLRLRHFSSRPLIEDDSVRQPASTLVNLKLGYRRAWWEGAVEVYNLFDAKTDEIAYFYRSRLPGEPAAGVEDVHFHPADPIQVRVSFTAHY
ncbi:MAG TPA: TonB-dependent receptor plug domain-containing protein [Haliangiales bacterium]|nr:TonB-dependent receptor plug domain-containing protein [Haliangiales bacterium]